MALSTNALTTLSTVKSELNLSSSTDDTYLERVIEAVSEAIIDYLDRPIVFASSITENITGSGGMYLVVTRYPITSVTSVSYDGTALDTDTYDATGWASSGLIRVQSGVFDTAAVSQWITTTIMGGTERRLYTVVYAGGYVTPNQVALNGALTRTLPYDIEDACIQAVVERYRKRGQRDDIKSEALLSYSVTYNGPSSHDDREKGLPLNARRILDGYKRMPMGLP